VLHTDDLVHVVLMWEGFCAFAVLQILGMVVVSKSSKSAVVCDSRSRSATTSTSSQSTAASEM
jgi:hypothetical protein